MKGTTRVAITSSGLETPETGKYGIFEVFDTRLAYSCALTGNVNAPQEFLSNALVRGTTYITGTTPALTVPAGQTMICMPHYASPPEDADFRVRMTAYYGNDVSFKADTTLTCFAVLYAQQSGEAQAAGGDRDATLDAKRTLTVRTTRHAVPSTLRQLLCLAFSPPSGAGLFGLRCGQACVVSTVPLRPPLLSYKVSAPAQTGLP